MLYLGYKIGELVAQGLPLDSAYFIADIAGRVYYWLSKKDRDIVINNMKVVLNSKTDSLDQVLRSSKMVFVSFGRYLVEFFRAPKIDLEFVKQKVIFEGKENLEQALSLRKGVLLVSAHLGNWEFGGIFLSLLGYKINAIAWSHQQKAVNDLFVQRRKNKGVRVIPLGTAIRRVFSALKNNEMVGLLGDIDYLHPDQGIKVKFFGQDAVMPQGPAVFSIKCGSPIIPVAVVRIADNRFKLILEKPIIYHPSSNQEADVMNLTQQVALALEFFIAQYPEQWFMLRPRWSNRL
ncbi:MAG: hypothetical protein JW714_01770 [Candidatus Omnitrophica bacterium]|nr:hypothetical protein [Candidatus Omnitrophota bacterium]